MRSRLWKWRFAAYSLSALKTHRIKKRNDAKDLKTGGKFSKKSHRPTRVAIFLQVSRLFISDNSARRELWASMLFVVLCDGVVRDLFANDRDMLVRSSE